MPASRVSHNDCVEPGPCSVRISEGLQSVPFWGQTSWPPKRHCRVLNGLTFSLSLFGTPKVSMYGVFTVVLLRFHFASQCRHFCFGGNQLEVTTRWNHVRTRCVESVLPHYFVPGRRLLIILYYSCLRKCVQLLRPRFCGENA